MNKGIDFNSQILHIHVYILFLYVVITLIEQLILLNGIEIICPFKGKTEVTYLQSG